MKVRTPTITPLISHRKTRQCVERSLVAHGSASLRLFRCENAIEALQAQPAYDSSSPSTPSAAVKWLIWLAWRPVRLFVAGPWQGLAAMGALGVAMSALAMDHGHHHHHPGVPTTVDLAQWVTLSSLSFFSSWHCIAMCGPLACATLGRVSRIRAPALWAYQTARLLGYLAVGLVLGMLHASIVEMLPSIGQVLSVTIGALVIAHGVATLTGRSLLRGKGVPSFLSARLARARPSHRSWALGLLTPLLPCMTLTPVLFAAAGSPTPAQAASLIAAFWVGTVPAMTFAICAPGKFHLPLSVTARTIVVGMLITLVGILTIVRGWPAMLHFMH